jgi:hypothetical protein
MGDILGIGLTHYPSLIAPDEERAFPLTRILKTNDRIPAALRQPGSWPEPMRREYGDDQGLTAARQHRERLVRGFRKLRAELDDFHPDFVVIWGDDQYENFREDIIPPFCILCYDQMNCKPFTNRDGSSRRNVWGESADKVFTYQGQPQAARALARGLLEAGIDMAYAYKPLHETGGLGHAFLNTLLFLDYDRQGFDYPVLPFQVNCYGSKIIRNHGGATEYATEDDPPGPAPRRCMAVGAATARYLRQSPWRVALIASSSWSHAFLTAKHHWLWPDIEADRARFEELRDGNYAAWRQVTTGQIEESGQQELLNWMCLAGAMEELGRKPEIVDYVESYVLNSDKCLALFKP